MIREILPELTSAVTYFTGGVIFYIVYRLCGALSAKLKPVLRLLPDFVSGLTGGGIFLLITELVAGATVKPYGIICYTAGFLLGSILASSSVPFSKNVTDTKKKPRNKRKKERSPQLSASD